jgi:hypothetical protein
MADAHRRRRAADFELNGAAETTALVCVTHDFLPSEKERGAVARFD